LIRQPLAQSNGAISRHLPTAATALPNLASRDGIGWNDKHHGAIERRDLPTQSFVCKQIIRLDPMVKPGSSWAQRR
jgi:hypothetical protein